MGPSVSKLFPFLVIQFLGLFYPQPSRSSSVLLLANQQALSWNPLSEVELAQLRVKMHPITPPRPATFLS